MANETLVIYYSWSNTTAQFAKLIQKATNADLVTLTVGPDVFADDMYATSDIATKQLATGQLPQLTNALPDLSKYETLLIGGPVWSGKVATPVRAFLKQVGDFSGTIAPFYTDAGTPGDYERDFKAQVPRATVKPGLGMTASQLQRLAQVIQQLKQWL